MIFVTVGTQLNFDRLISAVDKWVGETGCSTPVVAQIGNSSYSPKNFSFSRFLSPMEYQEYFENSQLIVSHAGMGTIINSLIEGKPIVVMPRRCELKEHRNDHQLATCRKFESINGCWVAWDECDLTELLGMHSNLASSNSGLHQPDELVRSLRMFIDS